MALEGARLRRRRRFIIKLIPHSQHVWKSECLRNSWEKSVSTDHCATSTHTHTHVAVVVAMSCEVWMGGALAFIRVFWSNNAGGLLYTSYASTTACACMSRSKNCMKFSDTCMCAYVVCSCLYMSAYICAVPAWFVCFTYVLTHTH